MSEWKNDEWRLFANFWWALAVTVSAIAIAFAAAVIVKGWPS